MAQVIRKYDWGGNIDYAPVKIYGTYYDPAEFDKEVSRRAQEYAQNGNYSGEKWQKFQSSVEAMKKGLMNGTITMTGDGKFTGAGLNSVWDEDAGRFFYKNLVDNGFKSTHTEPNKYNLMNSFTAYVNDTYGNNWDELDEFDEKTGLRGTANRSAELKKWLTAERNKLNSDISYRRNYSYKGTDSDVANWATRHNLTVQDINNILYALEDNTISDEENKTLPIGLNLNQFLSTSKDSEYHKTFIANQEAKAKQEKAKQEADWNRTNAFNVNWLYSEGNNYGITPSYLTYKGKDYTDFTNLDTEALEYLKTAKYNLHNQLSNNYDINGHKYRYAVDLTKFFDGNTFDLSGHQIIKAWDGDVSNMDSGSFYIYNPSGTYTPITISKNENGKFYINTPANNSIDIGYLSEYLDMDPDKYYSNFIQNNPNHILANSNFTYSDTGQKDEKGNHILSVTNGYITQNIAISSEYKTSSEVRQAIKNALLGIPTAQKGAKFKQREIPKQEERELETSESIIENRPEEDTDNARLGAAIADLTSTFVGLIPGAHFAGTGIGMGSSLTEFGADIVDLMSDRPGAQRLLSSTGELALNLGMDLVSLIPGGKSVKAVSTLRKLAGFVPHIAGAIQTGMIVVDPSQRKSMSETLTKLNSLDFTNINENDIRNLTFISRSLIGGYKLGKSALNSDKIHTSKGDSDVVTGQAIKDGKVVGEIEANVDHSAYNKKFGFNTNKKTTQAKAVEAQYKSDVEAKAKADVEQSMQKNDGESDVDFKTRKDAEIKRRVDEALKDVQYKIKNSSTVTSRVTFENGEIDTPRGNKNVLFSDAWFAENTGFGRRYYGLSKHTEPRRTTSETEWGPSKIREELVGRNLMDDNIRSKSDEELARLFPDIKSIDDYATTTIENNIINHIRTSIPKINKIPGWETTVRELNRSLNPNLDNDTRLRIIFEDQLNRLRAQSSFDAGQNLKRRKVQQDSDKLEAEKRKALRKQQYESKKFEANKIRVSEQKGWTNTLNEYINNHLPNDLKKFVKEQPAVRRVVLDMLRKGKSKTEIQEAIVQLKKSKTIYKQGGVIRKYQNSGQFTTLMMPDPYKIKLYDPNVLNKFNNDATNWAESYLSAVNSNLTLPQLGLTKEESDKLLVGNTIPVINTYDSTKKAEAKGYAEGLASVIRNSTIDSKQVTPTPGKDRYTFNPDMPTAYRLASLATNIFGNIAQTRKLIDNYKPFTRQAVQLPHVPVTGDYVSLQAGQTQAGNIRTAARNASQSTSDARLGIASELTGNTQAVTPVLQATAADITARKQSQAISQDVANKNLISATETANQNAFEYNKAHNYKTQLESQLIGLTAKNTDNFLKESQMKSEQLDAMMKVTEYKRRAIELSKTFENDLTKYANDNYLAKAKQYLTSKGTDISGMSNSSILDEYFKNNTLAYEEYQNYVDSQKNLFNSQLNNLQLEIYKGKPLLTVEDFLNTDKRNNPIYGNPRRIFKKGGSVREKAVIQQIKDRNKDKLETEKSNAKSLRDSDREFNKTYRHLSAGTLALLKKAME